MYPITSLNIEVNGQQHEVVLLAPDYGLSRVTAIAQCVRNGLAPASIEFVRALLKQHENVLRGLVSLPNSDGSRQWWKKTILALGSVVSTEEGHACCLTLVLTGIANKFRPHEDMETILCSKEDGNYGELDSAFGGDLIPFSNQ